MFCEFIFNLTGSALFFWEVVLCGRTSYERIGKSASSTTILVVHVEQTSLSVTSSGGSRRRYIVARSKKTILPEKTTNYAEVER